MRSRDDGAFAESDAMMSIVWSVAGIILCGGVGAICGWLLTQALGLDGAGAAIVAAIAGMVIATASWTGLTVLLRKLGILR
ncbi:MAG: hypothetical protein U1F41_04205 [Burkholderiales bacterium]